MCNNIFFKNFIYEKHYMFKIKFIALSICDCLLYGNSIIESASGDMMGHEQTSTHVYKDKI